MRRFGLGDEQPASGREEGVILVEGPGGRGFWLDRYARRGVPATEPRPPAGLSDSFRPESQSGTACAPSTDPAASIYELEIHVLPGRVRPLEIAEAVLALTRVKPAPERCVVVLHVDSTAGWWRGALAFLGGLRRGMGEDSGSSLVLRLQGTLTMPPEPAGDDLVRLGVALRYVWGDGVAGPARAEEEQRETLQRMAAFGFRLPVLWYLHQGNADRVRELAPSVLEWNRQSGLSVLPIQEHPSFGVDVQADPLPAERFVTLSAALYKEHPFFDDVFEPATSVMERLDRAQTVGMQVRLLFLRSGEVKHFHKVPALGRTIGTVERLRREAASVVGDLRLLEDGLARGVDRACGDCQWRFVCRGVDSETCRPGTGPREIARWACQSRLFWLSALAWERLEAQRSALPPDPDDRPPAEAADGTPEGFPSRPPASESPVPGSVRSLRLSGTPIQNTTVTHLDLDLTLSCNLACDYCFKEKAKQHMGLETALDAVVWLLHSSGNAREISIVFIGGEPLLRFDTIEALVPFAVRRARQHNKKLILSMTTNGTLVDDEVLDFCRRWGVGFHTSIDGHPAVQDAHRSYRNGRGSSAVLKRNLPRVLKVWPNATARSTVVPDTACEVYRSYQYFLDLGYTNVAFVPGEIPAWTEESLAAFARTFRAVAEDVIDKFRSGRFLLVKYIHDMCEARAKGRDSRPGVPCGAGRGMVLVDVNGGLWPCHRWNKAAHFSEWRQGSLYEPLFDEERRKPFHAAIAVEPPETCTTDCPARPVCGGGCPAENLEMMGTIHRRHPMACRLDGMLSSVGAYVHDTLLEERNPLFLERYYAPRDSVASNSPGGTDMQSGVRAEPGSAGPPTLSPAVSPPPIPVSRYR